MTKVIGFNAKLKDGDEDGSAEFQFIVNISVATNGYVMEIEDEYDEEWFERRVYKYNKAGKKELMKDIMQLLAIDEKEMI